MTSNQCGVLFSDIDLQSFVYQYVHGHPKYEVAPDVTPQTAASHLGLFCLLKALQKFSSKNEIKMRNSPDAPINESGLIKNMRMGKSIRHKWVKKP